MNSLPNVHVDYFPLGGGMDLLTPAISMPPGKVIDSQNYEPEIGGGYRRIDGFERYDGRTSPSSKLYWKAAVNLSGVVSVGNTITGVTSAATSKVLAVVTGYLILGEVTGTYTSGESISNGATVGTITTVVETGEESPELDADYTLLAANLQRANIAAVPGSGRIRGVWFYNNTLYAFRDNAGATAGAMYKATTGGWVQVTFGSEIQFTTAVGEIFVGNTITGLTSGATAVVVKPLLRTGTWTSSGAGTLIISTITGTWQSGEAIRVAGVTKATSSSLATSITRAPGGSLEFVNANFTGSTASKKMYGADGVNLAFEFDGTNYIPIRTGMATDTPSHITVHKFYLFLSFLGSVQLSSIGNPYSWTAVLGAAELTTGDNVTGFMQQAGSNSGASLAIYTEGSTFILYGSGTADFVLTPSSDDIGAYGFTMQSIGNDTMILTSRGIQRLSATQNYGNFLYASISHLIQPLMTLWRGLQTASTTLREKNQYRVYFSNGYGLAIGLTGDKVSGILPLNYGIPVRCMCTAELNSGVETTWFGSDTGMVYQDSTGTSFDGNTILSWVRLPFNNIKSPRIRKRYRSAVLEVVVEGYSNVDVTYELGYGTSDIVQSDSASNYRLTAAGSYWDQFTWDRFTWDSQSVGNPRIPLKGVEKNLSLLFYSDRAQDKSHTLQGVTILSNPLRIER
jgi:hypothetical protein